MYRLGPLPSRPSPRLGNLSMLQESFSARRCTVIACLLVVCGWSTGALAQKVDDALSARLVLVDRMLDGTDPDEGRLLDLKTQIESLPFVVRGDRKQARAANARGLKSFDAGQYDQATASFERGLAFDPADEEICNNLAFAYFRAGKTLQAWRAIKHTLALAPARTSAWANIGEMRAAQGEHAASVWSFENSYRFSHKPDKTRAYFEKVKAETEDSRLQTDLSDALAAIDSGSVQNWLNRPMAIGGLAASRTKGAKASDQDAELLRLFDRVCTGDKAAFATIQAAANKGQPLAQSLLGQAYRDGDGVVQDPKLSFTWNLRAAEQGEPLSQYEVAFAYQEGSVVAKNNETAALWYEKAVAQGYTWAMVKLGVMYDRGELGNVDREHAASLYRQASDLGDARGSYNLANDYFLGLGVPKDLTESARLWLLSANRGFAEADLRVAYDYDMGWGVPRNEKEALIWYRKAAVAGNEAARVVLKWKGLEE